MNNITFELEQTEEEKKLGEQLKVLEPFARRVVIKKNGQPIGTIFTPGGSGQDIKNAIQICGFTEAFDLWGCGVYRGYKDIQLLFDDGMMGGKCHKLDLTKCCRCYRHPCQCENKTNLSKEENEVEILNGNVITNHPLPFNVKKSSEIEDRLERV